MNEFDVLFAASEWRAGQERLKRVAEALRDAAPKMHEDFGGETGATAQVAFEKVGASGRQAGRRRWARSPTRSAGPRRR